MCGIHGVINKATFSKKEIGAFIEQAFVVNSLRGTDATGVFQIDKNGGSSSYKNNVAGPVFAELKHAKRFFTDAESAPLTVGHVRHGTVGKNVMDNAHPFVAERDDGSYIVGVHNGSLINWRSNRDSAKYDVDSEWAINLISTEGVDAFEKIQGAYCFVWWDSSQKDKLFMVRNEERPMHLLYNKAKDVLMFGSEAGMLAWLAERNKIETHDMIYSLEPHMLYTFDFAKPTTITWTKSNAPKYKAPVYNNQNSNVQRRGSWNAARGRWDGDHNTDAWDDGSAYDYSQRGSASGGSARSNSFPPLGERFVSEFNDALRENKVARYKRDAQGSNTVTTDGVGPGDSVAVSGSGGQQVKLNKRQRRALRKKGSDPVMDNGVSINANGDGIAPPHWYSTDTATAQEQQAAKSLGVMGELQWLTGVLYEPQTGEMLGDIEEYLVADKQKIKHIGMIRNISAAAADQHWINNKEGGGWACIIGVTASAPGEGRYFIMSPLTQKGREQMMKQAA